MIDYAKLLCFLVMVCIAFTDLRWRRIPNGLLLLLLAFGYMRTCLGYGNLLWSAISLLMIGVPLLLIGVNSGDMIGGGDVKMCAAAAFAFGAEPVLLAIAGTALAMLAVAKLLRQSVLPMAPFFAVCCMAFA